MQENTDLATFRADLLKMLDRMDRTGKSLFYSAQGKKKNDFDGASIIMLVREIRDFIGRYPEPVSSTIPEPREP